VPVKVGDKFHERDRGVALNVSEAEVSVAVSKESVSVNELREVGVTVDD
jgi:hypothetical protein